MFKPISMKCQILFSMKFKKNINSLSSSESDQRVLIYPCLFCNSSRSQMHLIALKMSPKTICMKSQILVFGKIMKTIINLSAVKFAHRIVKVNCSKEVSLATRPIYKYVCQFLFIYYYFFFIYILLLDSMFS